MCRSGDAGLFPIATLKDEGNLFGRKFSRADIEERAGEIARHFVEETIATERDLKWSDVDREERANGIFFRAVGKSGEIARA